MEEYENKVSSAEVRSNSRIISTEIAQYEVRVLYEYRDSNIVYWGLCAEANQVICDETAISDPSKYWLLSAMKNFRLQF